MIGALTWLTGSKLGRWVALGALGALLIALMVRSIRASGRSEAEAEAAAAQVERTREVLDAVRRMGEAQAAAPRDRRAVLERLRRGDA